MAILFGGFRAFDNYWYAKGDWQNFKTWNSNRVAITDNLEFIYTPEHKPLLDEIGWTENDYDMFISLLYFDDEIFTTEKVRKLRELGREANPKRHPPDYARNKYALGRPTLSTISIELQAVALIAMVACAFWMAMIACDRKSYPAITGMSAIVLMLIVYLIFGLNRLPIRVLQPMLCCVAVQGLVISSKRVNSNYALVWLLLSLVSFQPLLSYFNESDVRNRKTEQLTQALNDLPTADSDILVVLSLSIDKFDLAPWGDRSCIGRHRNYFVHLSSLSPFHNRRLNGLAVQDFRTAIVNRDDMYVLARDDLRELLKVYYEEHYDVAIESKVVWAPADGSTLGFKLLKFSSGETLDVKLR